VTDLPNQFHARRYSRVLSNCKPMSPAEKRPRFPARLTGSQAKLTFTPCHSVPRRVEAIAPRYKCAKPLGRVPCGSPQGTFSFLEAQ
jgi:hypothetical protein